MIYCDRCGEDWSESCRFEECPVCRTPLPKQVSIYEEIDRICKVVDDFSVKMKIRLAQKVKEGCTGWDGSYPTENLCDEIALDATNIAMGDANGELSSHQKSIDIANRAMMLWWKEHKSQKPILS